MVHLCPVVYVSRSPASIHFTCPPPPYASKTLLSLLTCGLYCVVCVASIHKKKRKDEDEEGTIDGMVLVTSPSFFTGWTWAWHLK